MAVEEYSSAGGEPELERRPSTELERRPSLVSLLVEAGVGSENQLQLALAEGFATGERLGEVVLRRRLIDQVGLARVLAHQWRLPFLEDAEADAQPKRLLPPGFAAARAVELQACPISGGEATVLLAVAEPSEERFTALREQLGGEVAFVVVAQATLERLFQQLEVDDEGDRAEASVVVGVAGAVAAQERERPLQQLVGELELASERLAELRARAEQLLRDQEQTQAELDASQRELEQLREQRWQDQATIAHLEQQLAEERRRLDAVKAKIGELSETLTGA